MPYRTYAPGDSLAGDTFARSGAATQDGSTGHTLSSVGTGVVRDAHFVGGQRTLLIESTRTQLASQTDNPGGSDWSNVGVTLTTGVTDPMGGTTAVRVTLSASVNSILRTGVPYTNGQPHVGKVWARKTNSGGAAAFYIVSNDQAAWNTGTATKITPTTDWQEYSGLVTLSTSTSINWLMFGNTDVSGNVDASCAGDIEFAFPQQEVASVASTTIPNTATNTPLTRGFDKLDWATPSGVPGTRYHKYIDLITGSVVEAVSAFTGSAITLDGSVDGPRAYLKLKWADGTQTLAFMQALGEYIPGGSAWGATAAALAFSALVAFTPQQAARIAPLIPIAQAPPVRGPLTKTDLNTIRASWPNPIDGAVQRFVKIAPLTLPTGQQPPRIGPQRLINQSVARNAWPNPIDGAVQRLVQVAPLTLKYGQQVITVSLSVQEQAIIRASWTDALVAPRPVQSAAWDTGLVVQSFVPSSNPAILGIALGSWRAADAIVQRASLTPIPSEFVPGGQLSNTELAIIASSWKIPDASIQRASDIAPLTLPYGDQPTPDDAISVNEFVALRSWAAPDLVQAPRPSTAWNIAAEQVALSRVQQLAIIDAWRLADVQVRRVVVAPLILPTGDQPTPDDALSANELVAIGSWTTASLPQTMRPTAAWNVPVQQQIVLSSHAQQLSIIDAWRRPDVQLGRRAAIAPLIVVAVVNAPQPHAIPQLSIAQWWVNPTLIIKPPRIVTLTLPTGDQPTPDDALNPNELVAIGAWNPAVITPRARANVAAWTISIAQPGDSARRVQYTVVLASWERPGLILRLNPIAGLLGVAAPPPPSTTQRFTLSML